MTTNRFLHIRINDTHYVALKRALRQSLGGLAPGGPEAKALRKIMDRVTDAREFQVATLTPGEIAHLLSLCSIQFASKRRANTQARVLKKLTGLLKGLGYDLPQDPGEET